MKSSISSGSEVSRKAVAIHPELDQGNSQTDDQHKDPHHCHSPLVEHAGRRMRV
jgi:hypothetical protein